MFMQRYAPVTFFEFQHKFATEDACFDYLIKARFPDGFQCPRCGGTDHYMIHTRKVFQCKQCRHQTSVTAGTIMHKTRTPLMKWFWAMYLIGSDKGGCSAMRLSKMIKVAYQTAWTMSHKIRTALEDRDTLYNLTINIELDDSWFDGRPSGKERENTGSKTHVLIGIESNNGVPGHVAMQVVEDVDRESVGRFAADSVEAGARIRTTYDPSYSVLGEEYDHRPAAVLPNAPDGKPPWVQILLGNVKNVLKGTYFGVSPKHLQRYLSEFCYRFNRRYQEAELFDRMLCACVGCQTVTYSELTG